MSDATQWAGTQCDLSLESFKAVIDTIGADPHQDEVVLYCGDGNSDVALAVETEYNVISFIIPPEILRDPTVWAVEAKGKVVWMDPQL